MKESKKLGLRIVSLAVCLTIACGGSIAAVRASGSTEEESGSAGSSGGFCQVFCTSWYFLQCPGP